MNEEDKRLLFQDLCARLPYGVICSGICKDFDVNKDEYVDKEVSGILTDLHSYKCCYGHVGLMNQCDIETIKPYLRPMSSMTEKEMSELRQWGCLCMYNDNTVQDVGVYGAIHSIPVIDWLNAHRFDYRGLIEKGLALPAPEGMYKHE